MNKVGVWRKALATFMLLVGILAVNLTVDSAAFGKKAKSKNRDCTAAEKTVADKQLWLNTTDKNLSIAAHLPWGVPRETTPTTNERTLVQRDYVNRYDDDLKVPIWSAERIEFSKIGKVPIRIDCFRPDPRIPATASARLKDYEDKGSIYDRGHASPDADQDSSITAEVNTYVLTNMSPQTCQFNRGIWQILESIGRLWAKEHGTVYIISGSVFDRDGDGRRDADSVAMPMESLDHQKRVAVPSAFYKIVAFRKPSGRIATITILMPHNDTALNGPAALTYLSNHTKPMATVEALTGLDLFPNATGQLDEATSLWPIVGNPSNNLCF
jgi:endonuclease G